MGVAAAVPAEHADYRAAPFAPPWVGSVQVADEHAAPGGALIVGKVRLAGDRRAGCGIDLESEGASAFILNNCWVWAVRVSLSVVWTPTLAFGRGSANKIKCMEKPEQRKPGQGTPG